MYVLTETLFVTNSYNFVWDVSLSGNIWILSTASRHWNQYNECLKPYSLLQGFGLDLIHCSIYKSYNSLGQMEELEMKSESQVPGQDLTRVQGKEMQRSSMQRHQIVILRRNSQRKGNTGQLWERSRWGDRQLTWRLKTLHLHRCLGFSAVCMKLWVASKSVTCGNVLRKNQVNKAAPNGSKALQNVWWW